MALLLWELGSRLVAVRQWRNAWFPPLLLLLAGALDLLAIGTVGDMILAMMSRVALGHTGRPLEVPRYIAMAFCLVLLAAPARSLIPVVLPGATDQAWHASAVLWIAALALFVWRYTPVLIKPRADGNPD